MKIVKELDGKEWACQRIRKYWEDRPAIALKEESVYWFWGLGDDGNLYYRGVGEFGYEVSNWVLCDIKLADIGTRELFRIARTFSQLMPFL